MSGEKQAFPTPHHNYTDKNGTQWHVHSKAGLTKRELLAAMMAQGIASACDGWPDMNHMQEQMRRAVACADILLEELEKPAG